MLRLLFLVGFLCRASLANLEPLQVIREYQEASKVILSFQSLERAAYVVRRSHTADARWSGFYQVLQALLENFIGQVERVEGADLSQKFKDKLGDIKTELHLVLKKKEQDHHFLVKPVVEIADTIFKIQPTVQALYKQAKESLVAVHREAGLGAKELAFVESAVGWIDELTKRRSDLLDTVDLLSQETEFQEQRLRQLKQEVLSFLSVSEHYQKAINLGRALKDLLNNRWIEKNKAGFVTIRVTGEPIKGSDYLRSSFYAVLANSKLIDCFPELSWEIEVVVLHSTFKRSWLEQWVNPGKVRRAILRLRAEGWKGTLQTHFSEPFEFESRWDHFSQWTPVALREMETWLELQKGKLTHDLQTKDLRYDQFIGLFVKEWTDLCAAELIKQVSTLL